MTNKNDHGHEHDHHEKLVKISVTLEEEHVEHLRVLAKEYSEALGQRWSVSALLRVACGDLLTKMGRIT